VPGIKEVRCPKPAFLVFLMQKQSNLTLLRAVCLSAALILAAQAVNAQYLRSYGGSWGYGLASSLAYPLTYLPYNLLYGYGYSGYALNNLIYQGSYAPFGYLPYGGRFGLGNSANQFDSGYVNANSANSVYGNYGQFGYGQSGAYPQNQPQAQPLYNRYNNNPAVYDQNYYQKRWQNQPTVTDGSKQGSIAPQTTAFNDPFSNSYPTPARSSASTQGLENTPPTAPDRLVKHTPLTDGFIQAINSRFDGDFGRAMQDREMHAWAQALHVVDEKKSQHLKLSESRKDAIENILKDSSLDSESKLETLRILSR